MIPRLVAFSLVLGGLREPLWFAPAGVAAWACVARVKPKLGLAAFWLPWLGWACVSALASSQPFAALPVLARWSAVLAVASLAASWTPKARRDWLVAFFIASAGLAAGAIATGAGHEWRGQMTGLIPPYSNYTAFVLAGAAAASAAWALHPEGAKGRERVLALALCVLCVACVILARSRGAWLGLGSAALVAAIRRRRAGEALGLTAAALLLAASPLFHGALFKTYRSYAEVRPRIWRAAAAIATESPWLGAGPGNFAAGFRRRPVPFEDGAARWSMSTDYAHGEPQQAAAETGWAGLLLWLLGAGAALRALFARAGDDPVREAAALAAAALTAVLLVDNMLQLPALAALWLTALAVAAPPPAAPRRWPKAAIAAGAALALVSWIPKSLAASDPALAARLFPADPGPREDLAYTAARKNDLSEAYRQFDAAGRLAPYNAIYVWRLAQIRGAAGDWSEAERLAGRAIELEPGFMRARLLRVEALSHLGRRLEALSELAKVDAALRVRGDAAFHSGYDKTVWEFDPAEYAAASASASGRK